MKRIHCTVLSLVLLAIAAGGCVGDRIVAPGEMRDGVLTDWYGHKTLYTFDKDTTNPPRSNCNGDCALKWPPFRPNAGERELRGYTIFKRDDGSLQWAYDGKPLYFYAGDNKVGDRNGDNANGVWHVVKSGS